MNEYDLVDSCEMWSHVWCTLVSWVTMIGGLVDSWNCSEAFGMFLYVSEEFNDGGQIQVGGQIHPCALKRGVCGDSFVACCTDWNL